jgi:uncharacterized protein DUF6353
MNLVPEVIGRGIARNALLAQKASPQMLFVAGVAGMVGGTVLACRSTLKAHEVLTEMRTKREIVRTVHAAEDNDYDDSDRSKDMTLLYFQTGVKFVRLYAPAVILGGLAIAALTSSHKILTTRNAGLTAAYAALDKGFKEYRARVIERYGEERDREFRYGIEKVEITDPETKKKRTIKQLGPNEPSVYARFFDESSGQWNKNPDYNRMLINSQQNWANDLLRSRGHVFLNEVYDMLGLERSAAGAVVGWILSDDGSTDNHISFDIFNGSEPARDFVNGYEGSILLDFNVDGVIYDKLGSVPKEKLTWRRPK